MRKKITPEEHAANLAKAQEWSRAADADLLADGTPKWATPQEREAWHVLQQLLGVVERRSRYQGDTRMWQTKRNENQARIDRCRERETYYTEKLMKLVRGAR